jgi:hypothetical protein
MNRRVGLFIGVLLVAGVVAAVAWRSLPMPRTTTAQPSGEISGTTEAERAATQPNEAKARATINSQPSNAPTSTEAPTSTRIPRSLDSGLDQFVRDFADLQARAKAGDLDAMKALYRGLQTCRGQPISQVEIDERIALMAGQAGSDPARVQNSRAFMQRMADRCGRLGSDLETQQYVWLRAAAEKGEAQARLDYVALGKPSGPIRAGYAQRELEYQKRAEQYLQEEIAAGNAQALLTAAHSYGPERLRAPNPTEEYAYLYAYTLAVEAAAPTYFESLRVMRERMSTDAIAQANALGEEIYTRCCGPRG